MDVYDLWVAHDRRQIKKLERLPVCFHCGEPVQQEMAVCLDRNWYCDECLELNRVEVDTE